MKIEDAYLYFQPSFSSKCFYMGHLKISCLDSLYLLTVCASLKKMFLQFVGFTSRHKLLTLYDRAHIFTLLLSFPLQRVQSAHLFTRASDQRMAAVSKTLPSLWGRFSTDRLLYCDVFVVGHRGSCLCLQARGISAVGLNKEELFDSDSQLHW